MPVPDFLDFTKVLESVSRILEVNPEDVKDLAGTTRKNAEHLLSNKQFNSLHLDASMLGGFPAAQDVVDLRGRGQGRLRIPGLPARLRRHCKPVLPPAAARAGGAAPLGSRRRAPAGRADGSR